MAVRLRGTFRQTRAPAQALKNPGQLSSRHRSRSWKAVLLSIYCFEQGHFIHDFGADEQADDPSRSWRAGSARASAAVRRPSPAVLSAIRWPELEVYLTLASK